MLSGYRGELPEASLIVSRKLGSFDSAAASLREAAARLRMTGVSGVLSTTNKGDLTVAFHALAGHSAQVRTFNCSLSRTEPVSRASVPS